MKRRNFLFGVPLDVPKPTPPRKVGKTNPVLADIAYFERMASALPPAYLYALQQKAFLRFIRNAKKNHEAP